ncbi:MAG: hypothetical protein GTO63_15225 [Anaerolineae bacterium]|nr:hypothetical protein [Anaerolineae bacterium]NIN96182.1 hypothetical protein [Anaerolineae bacterium]
MVVERPAVIPPLGAMEGLRTLLKVQGPPKLVEETGTDTISSGTWTTILTTTVDVHDGAVLTVLAHSVVGRNDTSGKRGHMRLEINSVAQQIVAFTPEVSGVAASEQFGVVCSGQEDALPAGTITINLQGRRDAGTGGVTFVQKFMLIWQN